MVCPKNRNISFIALTSFWVIALVVQLNVPHNVLASKESEAVELWAQQFGDELWELASGMTKFREITREYTTSNTKVVNKNESSESLIQSVVENVGRMLNRKIDAVNCILKVAEEQAEQSYFNKTDWPQNFTYYSSKYSTANNISITDRKGENDTLKTIKDVMSMYKPMTLDQDTHFYNISVNTTHSSVHVPINVYDNSSEVLETIIWSEALDEVFRQNYKSDPALSWQYFGSDTGLLRHFPAKVWESKDEGDDVDVYDCRKRSWYIETATCSKDIVVLLDNSGSMQGFRNFIAQLTVKSILDTFSNNDFINIYTYAENVTPLVECFNDTLLQATPENIQVFNDAMVDVHTKMEGYANVGKAFEAGFRLLEKYREARKCNESTSGCNQAIMLITDGIPGNLTEVFDKWNWLEDGTGTKVPVRIFTYLLGKEVTKVREIQWMACLNRGYYSHIQTLDEVQGEVLKYVSVIATPLVLQNVDHPPTWTHAFRDHAKEVPIKAKDEDEKFEDEEPPIEEAPRLMIAVGVPAFDRRRINITDSRRGARLLGVAATDVPVEDINKLSLPYKLGVNGYSFIVSNNGYVLLHPDLRPMESGILKKNYNSIDLTEVEQFDENDGVRAPGRSLLDLREGLISHTVGKVLNVTVRFHYDKMRRIALENYNYYYAPLPSTPFSLGLAIPVYGNTYIKYENVVSKYTHLGINMTEFFAGQNWKLHPEWVYCKYHYLEGHEYDNPEEEWLDFLKKMTSDPHWKWSEQYEVETPSNSSDKNEDTCSRKKQSDDAYYCNKELVMLLIFDAKITNANYKVWEFKDSESETLIRDYNATLRFVATMSGLTRWQFIHGEVEVEGDREFGDYHTTAVDETWYKSAILQHKIDKESFVYFVPIGDDELEGDEPKVTASYAIFPKDGGNEAPGSVVGFQFSQARMAERFREITSKVNCNDCLMPCSNDLQDCYVIDNNGYIVISERDNDTGKFFGEVEGSVLQALVDMEIFKVITVYDLQALCEKYDKVENYGETLNTPLQLVIFSLKWAIVELVIFMSRLNIWVWSYALEDEDYIAYSTEKPAKKTEQELEEEYFNRTIVQKFETVYYPCDKKSNLYLLQQERFLKGNPPPSKGPATKSSYSRPFYFKRIPHSNLLMVIIDTGFQTKNIVLKASPEKIVYDVDFPCHKLELNKLECRRLDECYTEHPDEANVTYCGKGFVPELNQLTSIMSLLALIVFKIMTHF